MYSPVFKEVSGRYTSDSEKQASYLNSFYWVTKSGVMEEELILQMRVHAMTSNKGFERGTQFW